MFLSVYNLIATEYILLYIYYFQDIVNWESYVLSFNYNPNYLRLGY